MVRSLIESLEMDLLKFEKVGMDVNVIRDLMDLYNPETPLKRKKELKEKYEVKQFDSNDRDSYPSNKLQLEKIKNNDKLEKHEAMFATMKPRELGAFHKQEPDKLNFIKKLMSKKNKILKREGIEVEPNPFQDALKNVQKSPVPVSKTESAETMKKVELPDANRDETMTEYIKEIFEGNIDSSTSYDQWLDQREQFELGLPYTKLDKINLEIAKDKYKTAMSGISGIAQKFLKE
tara:strand:- start:160 stop:861 length:702 start_codon:yes stop_codon:yes gene_type:complete